RHPPAQALHIHVFSTFGPSFIPVLHYTIDVLQFPKKSRHTLFIVQHMPVCLKVSMTARYPALIAKCM
ncbi:hypothetical protein, partial [Faecalibaculum rodentium]|uniref:hypothetical protein n=1 Tax=Faecalibaculum rodentium TaxID=1702221 RepID=UPI002611387D